MPDSTRPLRPAAYRGAKQRDREARRSATAQNAKSFSFLLRFGVCCESRAHLLPVLLLGQDCLPATSPGGACAQAPGEDATTDLASAGITLGVCKNSKEPDCPIPNVASALLCSVSPLATLVQARQPAYFSPRLGRSACALRTNQRLTLLRSAPAR